MRYFGRLFSAAFLALATTIWAASLVAQELASADLVEKARSAVAKLNQSLTDLPPDTPAKERVTALTDAIVSYEQGLGAVRAGLRIIELQKDAIKQDLNQNRAQISAFLSVLTSLERRPKPLIFGHPDGILANIRASTLLADMTPKLQEQAEVLSAKLQEIARLDKAQQNAKDSLLAGFSAAQTARADLSKAISLRGDLPKLGAENTQRLNDLGRGAASLEVFAQMLADAPQTTLAAGRNFSEAKGFLPWPAQGRLLLAPSQPDDQGLVKPGLTLATQPNTLVTAPWDVILRFSGRFLNYDNLVILEPQIGYLLILGGLETVYGTVGTVIKQGYPLGLMPGAGGKSDKDFVSLLEDDGAAEIKPLYIELRYESETLDPMPWFNAIGDDRRYE